MRLKGRRRRAETRPHPPNSTVSQALVEGGPGRDGLAAWASIEGFRQGDRQSLSYCRDRVGDVAFGTDRRGESIGNGRKRQVFRGAGGLRGEKPISRGSEPIGGDAEAG